MAASAFLKVLVKTVPYRIHTILTDNGVQFVDCYQGVSQTWIGHIFGRTCQSNGIEHRLTKPYHPWTNGQAERMVRTIKEATVKSFHYASIHELRRHVGDWLIAYIRQAAQTRLPLATPRRRWWSSLRAAGSVRTPNAVSRTIIQKRISR